MTPEEIKKYIPKWRTGDIGLKAFYLLTKEEKEQYVKSLLNIPESERSSCDEYIIRFNYKPEKKNFYTL